ncbi:hypothetical protein RhiirC2_792855 [Rhizophagus irregularis]|uniref:Uncharacterized protein n=1 Tax=Rhizophagus irregularis TaxID=588596 RepID=A0A2N1MGI9_9GLOM|nr:hypothetical protein RhiirC2_792855 [Rhizophagus irregularis]
MTPNPKNGQMTRSFPNTAFSNNKVSGNIEFEGSSSVKFEGSESKGILSIVNTFKYYL